MFPKIIGIMAATREGIVGDKGALPWHYSQETEFFRQTTKGHAVAMGARTYHGLPKQFFETRSPIVFKHSDAIPGAITVSGKEDLIAHCRELPIDKPVYMIGGAELAHYFIRENLLSEFMLTIIHKNYLGDTRLDMDLLRNWQLEIVTQTTDYTINRLINPDFKEL